MHIMWNIDKGKMLTASRRIDKCPTPGQRFSDKFPTAGTDKMTNTQQMPQLQQSYKIHKRDSFHPQMTLKPFHFNRLSSTIGWKPVKTLWKNVKYPVTSKHPVKNPVNLA